MNDLLPSQMKLWAAYLSSLEPEQVMHCATKSGMIIAKELDANEQKILGNALIVIGNIITKLSCFPNETKSKWQQTKTVAIEMQEIEIELQRTKNHLDELNERFQLIIATKY